MFYLSDLSHSKLISCLGVLASDISPIQVLSRVSVTNETVLILCQNNKTLASNVAARPFQEVNEGRRFRCQVSELEWGAWGFLLEGIEIADT
jgi:hypothetical protein